jgi:cytochrome c oxidase subunit 2
MLVALLVTAYGMGIHVPGQVSTVDPRTVAQTPPFDQPGVYQVGPNRFEVVLLAQIWFFQPREIRVPVGAHVTFIATSQDVVHGLRIRGTNVNLMLIPGQIARAEARFTEPGEYLFLCHEYCGVAHHTMAGRVIVEP